MTETAEHLATRWAQSALGALEPRGFAQIDIDQLISLSTAELAREASIEAFIAVRDVLSSQSTRFTAAVVFPLEPTAAMEPTPISLEDWPDAVDLQFNVPALYIAPLEAFFNVGSAEEYRVSLRPIDPRLAAATSYFHVSRSRSDADLGWEFARAVYILNVPASDLHEVRVDLRP